jgi:hypothetical protein
MESAVYYQPEWVQPKTFKNRYELRGRERVFATLEFPRTFGSLAIATTTSGVWTFKRVGFFNTRITVRSEGQEQDLAVYHPRWTGTQGKLELAGGTKYIWKVANFWATQFVWETEAGQVLITYRPGVEASNMTDWFKTQARVEFATETAGGDFRASGEFALLVALGWYLMVLKQEDDAAATAAATSAY